MIQTRNQSRGCVRYGPSSSSGILAPLLKVADRQSICLGLHISPRGGKNDCLHMQPGEQKGSSNHVMGESRGRSPPKGDGLYTYTTIEHEHAFAALSEDEMSLPSPYLSVLKTKAESRAQAETLQCWTVELPVKAANNILMYDVLHLHFVFF